MAHLLSAFPDEYDADIQERIMERIAGIDYGYGAGVLPHALYTKSRPTTDYVTQLDVYSGFGEAQEWADGASVPMDSSVKEFARSATQVGYGLGFKVGRHLVRYGKSFTVQDWADALADSFIALMRTKASYLLNNAFSSVTYGDGKNLCATDHPTAGGTRSNELAVATALSFSSYDSVRLLGTQHVDYRGKARPLRFDTLIVPEQLEVKATQIVGSPKEPYTTDNQINPHMGRTKIVVEDRLSSSTAHFQLASGSHGLRGLVGFALAFGSYVEDATKSLVHYGETDFVFDVSNWPGIAGTAGA